MIRFCSLRRTSTQTASLFQTALADEQSFPKLQKFTQFCDQMERFAKYQEKVQKQKLHRDHEFKTATFSSTEPVKSALNVYISYRQDWDSEHTVTSLEWLAELVKARGEHFYSDLSLPELYEDWRFLRIVDDIRIGVKPGIFFPADHIGRSLRALASIGYKHSELFVAMAEKAILPQEGQFQYSPKGHHIYTGFQTNPDFQSYVRTLLEWKTAPAVSGLIATIQKAVDQAHQGRTFNKEFAAATINVATQYFDLVKAQHENPLFQKDIEVDDSLSELQEVLVRAGLMHPDDFDKVDNFINLDLKMQRAELIFNGLQTRFPYLNAPIVNAVANTAPEKDPYSLTFAEARPLPDPNFISSSNFSQFVEGLADMMTMVRKDRGGSDFPNEFWQKKYTHFLAERVPELIDDTIIAPHMSTIWQHGLKIFNQILQQGKDLVPGAATEDLCLLLYGFSKGRVHDSDLCAAVDNGNIKDPVSLRARVRGLYATALTGRNPKLADALISTFPVDEIPDMERQTLVQLVWALCVLKKMDSPLFAPALKALNDGTLLEKDMDAETSQLAYDISQVLSIEMKSQDFVPQNYIQNITISYPTFFDPLKSLVQLAIKPLMGLSLTQAESKFYKSRLDAYTPKIYPVDDMLVLNQHLAPVLLVGSDGFSVNDIHPLGYIRIRQRLLNALGHNPLVVPLHWLANIDFEKGSFELNRNFDLKHWVQQRFGVFTDNLQMLDSVVEEMLGAVQNEEKRGTPCEVDVFDVLKNVIVLYKLQNELKLKFTSHEISEKIEEMQLQIVKINVAYEKLSEKRKSLFAAVPNCIKAVYNVLATQRTSLPQLPEYLNTWVGLRQAMELPAKSQKKEIDPELLNQSFLWISNFYHYRDWEERLVRAYPTHFDMCMEATDQQNQVFFTGRRQLYGKTPNPLISHNALGVSLSDEERLIASLTNVKYELKRTLTDSQLLQTILNLDLISGLAREHTKPGAGKGRHKLVHRNPIDFVRMLDHAEHLKGQTDQFAKHYRKLHLKESARDRLLTSTFDKLQSIKADESLSILEKHAKRNEAIETYMETFRESSPDNFDLEVTFGDFKKQTVKSVTDTETLKQGERTIFDDPDFLSVKSDEEFLQLKRIKAEAKLIKAAIIRKLANDTSLSPEEQEYFVQWKTALRTLPLGSAGKAFLPHQISNAQIRDLSQGDMAFFRNLHNVSLPSNCDYSLNELVLELSHFIDDEVINRVEFLLAEANELTKWQGLFPDTSGRSKLKPDWHNKEALLVNQDLEEYLWRQSGRMTPDEMSHFDKIFGHLRGRTRYDRIWWPLDQQSWREFMAKADLYDNRLALAKSWYQRKERQSRDGLPSPQLMKSDEALHADYVKALTNKGKQALERHMDKQWETMTDSQLQVVVDGLVAQLLNKDLELHAVDIVQGILHHPALSPRTREHGDSLEPMATHPVALVGDAMIINVTPEQWEEKVERANANYVAPLLRKFALEK